MYRLITRCVWWRPTVSTICLFFEPDAPDGLYTDPIKKGFIDNGLKKNSRCFHKIFSASTSITVAEAKVYYTSNERRKDTRNNNSLDLLYDGVLEPLRVKNMRF